MARLLTRLKIREVSAVDRGAGEGVKIMLMKRREDRAAAAVVGKKTGLLATVLAKLGIDGRDEAETFSDVMTERLLTETFWNDFYKATDALRESLCSIVDDETVVDKGSMVATSLAEFSKHVTTIVPSGVEKTYTDDLIAAGIAAATPEEGTSAMAMTDVEKKAFDEAQARATAAAAEITKRDETIAVLSMPAAHQEYAKAAKLAGETLTAFVKKTEPERDAVMKAAPIAPPTMDPAIAAEFAKRDTELADLRKRNVALEDENAKVVFAKKATDLGLPAEFGETIRKAEKGDVAAVQEMAKKLGEAATASKNQDRSSVLFAEFGKGRPDANGAGGGDPNALLTAKADALRAADPKLSKEAAFTKAYEDPANRDIVASIRTFEKRNVA